MLILKRFYNPSAVKKKSGKERNFHKYSLSTVFNLLKNREKN